MFPVALASSATVEYISSINRRSQVLPRAGGIGNEVAFNATKPCNASVWKIIGTPSRDETQNLQEIVQIEDIGGGKTKIVSSMMGWGTGKEWDETSYAFFARGNEWTYQQLAKSLSRTGLPVTR